MGFDWAHTISSISKLILRSARNAVDGGSVDNSSKDCRFERIKKQVKSCRGNHRVRSRKI